MTDFVKMGEFDRGLDMRALVRAGLLPQSNFQIHDRYTKQLQSRIVELVLQNYVADQLLTPAPVSFFQPAFEWQKEKAMGKSELSMNMLGRSIDQADFDTDSVILPGRVKNYGYSWRQAGIASTHGVPLVSNTERQAIKRMLLDANGDVINGTSGDKFKGIIDKVPAGNAISATAVFSDLTNSNPYDDFAKALDAVAALDYEVPAGWTVGINPTNAGEMRRHLVGNDKNRSMWSLVQTEIGNRLKFVETTAVPEGTIIGCPRGAEYAELATTGVPQVVPIKADNVSVEYQLRMIAVPVFYDANPFWKITGV